MASQRAESMVSHGIEGTVVRLVELLAYMMVDCKVEKMDSMKVECLV